MNFEELEHKYRYWHDEYLFYKDNCLVGIILIWLCYFAYLLSIINNNHIEFGLMMYTFSFYVLCWEIHYIFKLSKAIKMRDYFDNEIYLYFKKSGDK